MLVGWFRYNEARPAGGDVATCNNATMKRSEFNGRVLVYRFRCPVAASNIPEAAETQFRLAHELRNELVAVERAHADAVAAIWADHPDVAATLQAQAVAEAAVAELVERAGKERIADRAKEPRAQTRAEIKAARATLAAARQDTKAARSAAYPLVRPAMADAQTRRRQAIGDAGRGAKTRGLFWHTHDAVLAGHDTAVKRVAALRAEGKPAELRSRRWDGEGRIRVTLMRHEWSHGCGAQPCGQPSPECPRRQPGDPLRTPALLAGGQGPWRNVCRLPAHMDPAICAEHPPRRHGERETILLRVGSEEREPIWWELPVFVHRPLPPGADVAFVEVRRERLAGQTRLSVCVTVRLPPVATLTEGAVAAIHPGWRSVTGGIRVMVIAASRPLGPIPERFAPVVRPLTGNHVEIIAPEEWVRVLGHADSVRSIRDQALDVIRRKIVDALAEDVPGVEVSAADVARWRSPGRFAALVRQWPNDHPLADVLWAWRRQDRHLWKGEAHERDQIAARRTDTWRHVAVWLCDQVAVIGHAPTPIAELSRVPVIEDGDDRQATLARAHRALAAPAELVSLIEIAAGQRGVRIVEIDGARLTATHHVCGEVTGDLARDSVMLWCSRCGIAFDQDANAATASLARTIGDLSSAKVQ